VKEQPTTRLYRTFGVNERKRVLVLTKGSALARHMIHDWCISYRKGSYWGMILAFFLVKE
jgi:hypothetical protein